MACVHDGQIERADALLTAGLEIAKDFDYKEGIALCTEIKGRLVAERGTLNIALELTQHALHQFDDLFIAPSASRCRRQLDTLLTETGA